MKKVAKIFLYTISAIGILIVLLPFLLMAYLFIGAQFHLFDDFNPNPEIQLINGYTYDCTSSHMCRIYHDGTPVVPEKVVELDYDDRYIIVKQYGMKPKYPNNPNNSYEIPNENEIYYRIIDTKEIVIFGPYDNLNEFKEKADELNISYLKFKDVKKFR